MTALSQLYRSAAPAQAAGNAENAAPTVKATVQHAETGQITAQIEAYMTDSANKTRTVKPCDIIFLIEQSKFMNTQNGSDNSGGERAEILNAMESLLTELPTPTTGGEHRIAIAGYGRINNDGSSDHYDSTDYPGTRSDNNASLNTGYYTKDGGFHSQSKWTECDGKDDASLPQLPSNYLTDDYEDVFLSVSDAKQVIDANTMVPWYAGAARMDAGLTITERLASIAKAHKAEVGKDRNLIVCIAASSLPYQNSSNYQKLRPEAAKAAANMLKETYDATIFGLGDFHQLNLESSNPLHDVDKQRDNFNSTMASICGNASTTNGADYFKGLSQVNNINDALKELITQIDANVGEGTSEEMSIHVDNFTEGAGKKYSWSQLKKDQHILSAGSIREVASVDYYRFTGYDSSGTPLFESTPSRHTEQSLADIGGGDAIQTSLNILPIPPQAHAGEIRGANYGEKVVITITDPVCIDYQWIGRWQPDIDPPKHEHAARATTHKPAAPTQNAVAGKDLNLKFDGWYTDEQCKHPFVDGTVLNTDTVLYGLWKAEHGKLSVAKTVAGNNGDTSKAFNFTVTLGDTGINGTFGDLTFANGVATFVLKHGESKTAVGLPAGITYTVTEAEADKDGYTSTSVNASGSIIKNNTAAAVFTNTRNSSSHHSTRYTLHYESNGGTAYKDERCSSGTKVTLDKTPTRESYTFTGWYADKALTQKITSVTMNGDKTVYTGWEATGVPDKLNGDDHFAYVIGYPDGKVHPEGNISRAETATIFFRLLKADIRDGNLTADNEFSDVSDGQWHNKAVSTMAKLGIVKGRRADRFDPNTSITRAEFAAICARFSTRTVENSGSFSDISGHWAENEIERAAAFGWISGYPDGTFRPDARITRAEAMTMINRVLCRMPQSESDLLDSMVTWSDNKPSDWHYLAVQEATNSHDFDRQGEVGESWTKLTSVPDWTRYQ